MTASTIDTWFVAALGAADRVLLLGEGWRDLAVALADQGVAVTVDRPLDGPAPAGPVVADGEHLGAFPVVGVALDGHAGPHLDRAVAACEERLLTRLDVARAGDLGSLARSWPLTPRADLVADGVWAATWDRAASPTQDLPARLLVMLHASTQSAAAATEAAITSREEATRTANTWRRREAAANARAQTTLTLANRWSDSRDAMVDSLLQGDDTAAVATPSGTGFGATLRSLLGRHSPAGVTSEPPVAPRGQTPGWRVAVVPGVAADWLDGWVDATRVAPGAVAPDALVDEVGGHLDVLVIGPVEHADRAATAALARAAATAGAAVVGVASGGMPWPGFPDLCDVVLSDHPDRAGPRTLALPPPVDPRVVNPTIGFRFAATGLATVVTGSDVDLGAVRGALDRIGVSAELVGAGTEHDLPGTLRDRARAIGRFGGVVDVPDAHAGPPAHARLLVELTAAGVPVAAPMLPDAVADMLGPVLAHEVRTLRPVALDDPHTRERHSVRQRRAALWAHGHEARWRRLGHVLDMVAPPRPPVSAVVVTNRPGHLAHCAAQLARQTYRPLEVVLGMHGDAFRRADVDAFLDRIPVDVTTVPIDGHRTLGEGLNLACQAASGTIVTKWDDDDHYGPDHVADLVQALDYSGATIVGKGSEFVHLGQLDVTIRRFVGKAESGSRSLAGGTLALRREDLAAAGWWRRIPRSVDQRLLDDVQRAGGRVHRTHGYGFVLARRADGHTWAMDVDYFLGQSEAQWRGLAREAAGLDDRVLPLPPDLRG